MPNLQAGFAIVAHLPASPVLFTSELLTERVVPVPLEGSTVVEGTVCPTTVSSQDAEVRGILAAGLGKAKTQIKTCKSTTRKYSIAKQLATYLSLVVWEELLRFLATDCNTRFIKEHKPSNHIRARIKSHVYTTE